MEHDSGTPPPGSADGPIKVNGKQLDFALRARGMSRNELARRVGTDPGHISRAINGHSRVSAEIYGGILTVFGDRITWSELMAGPDD